jgi:adenosylcobinamide-GDP ribazoletransferase
MKSVLAALKFLTFAGRFEGSQVGPQQAGALFFFPVVGIVLGWVLVLLNRLLDPRLESEILGTFLVAFLALLTGAIHYEGLQKTFDALSAKKDRTEETGRGLALGILAIVFVVLFKVRALEVTGEARGLGLLLSPLLARWSVVVFLHGSVSFATGTAKILAEKARVWHLALTTLLTLGFAFFLAGQTTLWIGLYLSLFALLSRGYLRRRNGAIDGDNLGAVIELNETLSFVLFASL